MRYDPPEFGTKEEAETAVRRVFARDLTALFQERLGLSTAEIGAVRVFEKYSFVEVASARAAEAVHRLSGVEFKGRQLNVEVAKRKEEKPAP